MKLRKRDQGGIGLDKIIRRRIIFYGRVQGVGFRWHAKMAASRLGITGWVRNEYDGSVTMEIQGREAELDRMVLMLQAGRYIVIEHMDVTGCTPDPEERSFRVRSSY